MQTFDYFPPIYIHIRLAHTVLFGRNQISHLKAPEVSNQFTFLDDATHTSTHTNPTSENCLHS